MSGAQYDQAVQLLPVLDLQDGRVVAARAGDRQSYAPIRSPLVAGSHPADMLAALLARSGGRQAYLADLDAIRHGEPQFDALRALLEAFPGLLLWLDGGFRSAAEGHAVCARVADGGACQVRPVLGTETLAAVECLSGAPQARECVLSLDFGPEGYRGDRGWLERPQDWPDRVIVMTLSRVGMAAGPDLERLCEIRARAGSRQVFAAGGVRHPGDLAALARHGITGALVASALHAGQLGQ